MHIPYSDIGRMHYVEYSWIKKFIYDELKHLNDIRLKQEAENNRHASRRR